MSNYSRVTKHPITGKFENADWLDDYYGKRRYGVRFPGSDEVFVADSQEWEFEVTPAEPDETFTVQAENSKETGGKFTEQENATVRGVPNPGTPSIPKPGPQTSSESPQTLGVTAGEITGTDEGGPGTIEAGQGRFVPNNWPGFAWELDFYGAALLPHQRQGILSAHEADCAQREAQAVIAELQFWVNMVDQSSSEAPIKVSLLEAMRTRLLQLRATGTGEETNTN